MPPHSVKAIDRLDVVEARSFAEDGWHEALNTDVNVAIGLAPAELRAFRGRVVVLASTSRAEPVGGSIRAYLPLDAPLSEVEAAVFVAAQNLFVLTPAQATRALRTEFAESETMFIEALTHRELQVLRMLADGLGNKEIAADLGISEHTAKFHVSQILAKLGASSRAEAVAMGMRRGLVPV